MALVRKKVTSIKWPVSISSPTDGGKWKDETYTGTFKKVGIKQIEELADKGDPQLIREVLEAWEDIKDEDGNEIPFSTEELDLFLDDVNFIKGTVQAIIEMQKGASEKN